MRTGQGRTLRPLPVLAVARNCSFRFEKSFICFKASFSDTAARRERSIFSSLIDFSFFMMTHTFLPDTENLSMQPLLLNVRPPQRSGYCPASSLASLGSRQIEPDLTAGLHFNYRNGRFSVTAVAILVAILESFAIIPAIQLAVAEL